MFVFVCFLQVSGAPHRGQFGELIRQQQPRGGVASVAREAAKRHHGHRQSHAAHERAHHDARHGPGAQTAVARHRHGHAER